MSDDAWATLGLARTSDRDQIRRAYARQLRATNPEDDPDGFKALRTAYESARAQAEWGFDDDYDDGDSDGDESGHDAVEVTATTAPLQIDSNGWDLPDAAPAEIIADPELDELQVHVDALAASVETAWGSDPALLDALLASPAMERLSERAWVETWVARLIVDNEPKGDALIAPAIAAFGWDARYGSDWAINGVLERARALNAPPPPRKGFFNRFGDWSLGDRPWWQRLLLAIVIMNVVRILLSALAGDAPTAEPPGAVPVAAPQSLVPLTAVPPDAGRWLTREDVVADGGTEAPTVKVKVNLVVGRAGKVVVCAVQGSEPASGLGEPTCRLLRQRVAFGAAAVREIAGRPLTMTAIWSRQADGGYAPLPIGGASVPDPTRRAPECPPDPAERRARDPVPCSAQDQWLRFADFSEAKLLAAGSRTLTAHYEIDRDGFISNCRLDPASGVRAVDHRVCKLLEERAHYLPGRDEQGRALRWKVSLGWGWTVTKGKAPPPPVASVPEITPAPADPPPTEPGEPE